MAEIHSRFSLADNMGAVTESSERASEQTRLPLPEKAILSAHKQFTLLHKSIDTKATCLAENFR
jgi:hypothetical protein